MTTMVSALRGRDAPELLERLAKVEGQIRGIHRMVVQQRRCVDILNQIAAARAALDQIAVRLLVDHTRGCMAEAIQHGSGDEMEAELSELLKRLL